MNSHRGLMATWRSGRRKAARARYIEISGELTLAGDAEIGSELGTLSIHGLTNGVPSWSLSDDADGTFAVDPDTGVVTLAGELDYEGDPAPTITVAVDGLAPKVGEKTFTITVTAPSGGGAWILSAGTWNDAGVWNDAANWRDAA